MTTVLTDASGNPQAGALASTEFHPPLQVHRTTKRLLVDADLSGATINATVSEGGTTNEEGRADLAPGASIDILALDADRIAYTVANVGEVPIMVRRGSTATASNYTWILAGGTADLDGLGATLFDDEWNGAVSLHNPSGADTAKYSFSEVSP